MSLLNKMLRDLDARRASETERQGLPGDVRPLPPPQKGARLLPGLLVAAALIVAGGYWGVTRMSPAVQPTTGNVASPSTAPAPPPAVAPPPASVVAAPPAAAADARLKLETGLSQKPPPNAPAASRREAEPAPAAKPAAIEATGRIDKRAVAENPLAMADAEFHRGQGLLGQGQREEAAGALRKALTLSAYHAGARQALFVLLLEERRVDEARALLEEGLQVAPAQSVWAMNLARLQLEKGDAAAAWETLQRTLPFARQDGEFRGFCGTVLQRLNRSREAVEHFNAALRTNPAEGRWWLGLAMALESDGHPAEGREAYARAKATGSLTPDLAAFAEQKSR